MGGGGPNSCAFRLLVLELGTAYTGYTVVCLFDAFYLSAPFTLGIDTKVYDHRLNACCTVLRSFVGRTSTTQLHAKPEVT